MMDSQETASHAPSSGMFSSLTTQPQHEQDAFTHNECKQRDDSDESDFFADIIEDEDWSKLKSTDEGDDIHGDMVMDLSAVFPVGGMRRVSSCYFSICSNVSSDENVNDRVCDSPFTTTAAAADDNMTTATTGDFLYHDILMNVFTYLDAASLAAFSETGKRPNFECFYFLELQLQRGLLRGTSANPFQLSCEGAATTVAAASGRDGDIKEPCHEEDGLLFIAGTGAISRLASLDESKAREIVQTYLDSNSSIRAMPLSHSLAYIRQVLRQHGLQNMKMRMPQPPQVPTMDDIMPAKNARNVALFFTFLGAASYMHGAAPEMPDPSEVINAENIAALMKMGLAGGVLKTMKEAASKTVGGSGANTSRSSEGNNTSSTQEETSSTLHSRPRPSSMGSLDDLSHMLPATITSRLYNAFSLSPSLPNVSSLNQQPEKEEEIKDGDQEITVPTSSRPHRSKRSHSTSRLPDAVCESKVDDCNPSSSLLIPALADENNDTYTQKQGQLDPLTPDMIAKAIKHPVSSNPYDHPNPSDSTNFKVQPASLFSFNAAPSNTDGTSLTGTGSALDSGEAPSGCVGAYARAVKNAALHVTRLVKQQRKANFEALDVDEQMELGLRFIDACSSDDKLPIVKDILQKQNCMDVDRFFVGPDDTETCALHAAAFNGAEQVLEFLSGGIDEYNPRMDMGLCDVDVRDANGWTALHFAAGANSVSSVRILAVHGAKLTIEASNGYTPYHWAERLSNEEVAKELQNLGADNRFVGRWMFGSSSSRPNNDTVPFVSFLANRFFGNSR